MNKGQHNTFKKLSPDFFSIEVMWCYRVHPQNGWYNKINEIMEDI